MAASPIKGDDIRKMAHPLEIPRLSGLSGNLREMRCLHR